MTTEAGAVELIRRERRREQEMKVFEVRITDMVEETTTVEVIAAHSEDEAIDVAVDMGYPCGQDVEYEVRELDPDTAREYLG